jgi:predicted Zn-dependent protease
MLKLGEETDTDAVIFGKYSSDGSTLTVTARVLQLKPPSLSTEFRQSGALSDLMNIHARLTAHLSCALAQTRATAADCSTTNQVPAFVQSGQVISFSAFETYIHGLTESSDDVLIRDLRQAARLQPQWDAPVFALGDYYYSRRNCEAALPLLTRVSTTSPSGTEAAFETGVCYLLRADPAHAENVFSGIVNRAGQPALPGAQNNLGVALMRGGKFTEAGAALQQATTDEPQEPDYWVNLGLTRLQGQMTEAAIDPLRRASWLQPLDNEVHALLAFALEQSGRMQDAQAERAKAGAAAGRLVIPRNPAAADFAKFERIRMRLESGALRPQTGKKNATAGTQPDTERPHGLAMHVQRGKQFLESGNLDDAQRSLIEALLMAPVDPAAHSALAEVYDKQGRPNDAVREYHAALINREDAQTRIALAELLLRLDRPSEARNEVQIVLGRDSSNSKARELMERVNARAKQGVTP